MRRWSLIAVGVTVMAILVYLLASEIIQSVGFPLDDAWIHQTYARNFAKYGEWTFIPGHPSAGSTAPLWSFLLSINFLFSESPFIWTFALGAAALIGLSLLGGELFCRLSAVNDSMPGWIALLLAAEWHLVWAAVSGMETILFALLIVLIFYELFGPNPRWLVIGLFVGILVWVRPDGITLIGPGLLVLLFAKSDLKKKTKDLAKIFGGLLPLLIFYMMFNFYLSGNIWPNTLYAKQTEYAVLQEIPLINRFLSLSALPLVGVGSLLLPGTFYFFWGCIKNRNIVELSLLLWWLGYTGIYAWKLPLGYQHGRYLIPVMPVFFIFSMFGCVEIWKSIKNSRKLYWVLKRTWLYSGIVVWISFIFLGAYTYANDVAIINTEMVTTAKWISENTQADSKIAAHDIGALGFFGKRQIVDLAGLISPEIIPIMREEGTLAVYLDHENVNYLMTFPAWYPKLIRQGVIVYNSQGIYSPQAGGENMLLYRW